MADYLILMRHGKAQRRSDDLLDMERRLTEAGKRSLVATLPQSLRLMSKDNGLVQIWSSPAARAEQTARLVRKACKRSGFHIASELNLVEELWSQDIDAFLDKVRSSEADTVFAVGHNPFIEDLTTRITGSQIVFATGGFAAMALSSNVDPALHPGRLLWFAQGPISQRWKTIVHMERVLREAADNVNTKLEAFIADPEDVETMHKFRVSIRTLRSLLAFVAPWQQKQQNKDAQVKLRDIVRETSRLRELDVLTEQANDLESASPELATFCAAKAAEERKRVINVLSSKKTAKQLNGVISELHNVKWNKDIIAQGLDAADVRARFDDLAHSLELEIASLDLKDEEQTHDVRKNAKRVRYDAEQFEKLIGEDAVEIAKNMTAHQDNLGAICDARVNIDIINSFPAKKLPKQVALDLALLRTQNETFLNTTLHNA